MMRPLTVTLAHVGKLAVNKQSLDYMMCAELVLQKSTLISSAVLTTAALYLYFVCKEVALFSPATTCINLNPVFQQAVIPVCICMCYNSDLAQDLTVLEEHFGYSYIELQLVSQLSFAVFNETKMFRRGF